MSCGIVVSQVACGAACVRWFTVSVRQMQRLLRSVQEVSNAGCTFHLFCTRVLCWQVHNTVEITRKPLRCRWQRPSHVAGPRCLMLGSVRAWCPHASVSQNSCPSDEVGVLLRTTVQETCMRTAQCTRRLLHGRVLVGLCTCWSSQDNGLTSGVTRDTPCTWDSHMQGLGPAQALDMAGCAGPARG